LCPRAYLRVPDHGHRHLRPCCGYLPWRSRGLNTDSWRPPWGHRHDHQANSKDLICKINLSQHNCLLTGNSSSSNLGRTAPVHPCRSSSSDRTAPVHCCRSSSSEWHQQTNLLLMSGNSAIRRLVKFLLLIHPHAQHRNLFFPESKLPTVIHQLRHRGKLLDKSTQITTRGLLLLSPTRPKKANWRIFATRTREATKLLPMCGQKHNLLISLHAHARLPQDLKTNA
jgi:hypothetical protein